MRLTALVALLLVAGTVGAQSPIRLRNRDLQPIPQPAAASRAIRGGHYILGFSEYPDLRVRAGLARRGIRVLQYVPDSALMVSVPSGASLEGLDLRDRYGSARQVDARPRGKSHERLPADLPL